MTTPHPTSPPQPSGAGSNRARPCGRATTSACDTSTYLPSPTTTPGAASGVSSASTPRPSRSNRPAGREGQPGDPQEDRGTAPRDGRASRARPRPRRGAPARHPDAADRLGRGITSRTLLVALVDKGDKINAARLGGDNGRYWRLPRAMLAEIVDPATVLNPDATR